MKKAIQEVATDRFAVYVVLLLSFIYAVIPPDGGFWSSIFKGFAACIFITAIPWYVKLVNGDEK